MQSLEEEEREEEETGTTTVVEAIAEAEAWSERAAMFATLGFECRELFANQGADMPAPYFIRRLAGGSSEANVELVEQVRLELFAAARAARDQARRILRGAATPPPHTTVATVDGGQKVAPRVSLERFTFPALGDEITANESCPLPRRRLDFAWTHPDLAREETEEPPSAVTPIRERRR